jgi:hypothetical protein
VSIAVAVDESGVSFVCSFAGTGKLEVTCFRTPTGHLLRSPWRWEITFARTGTRPIRSPKKRGERTLSAQSLTPACATGKDCRVARKTWVSCPISVPPIVRNVPAHTPTPADRRSKKATSQDSSTRTHRRGADVQRSWLVACHGFALCPIRVGVSKISYPVAFSRSKGLTYNRVRSLCNPSA